MYMHPILHAELIFHMKHHQNSLVDWCIAGTSPGAALHLHQRHEVHPGQCLLDGTGGRRESAGS